MQKLKTPFPELEDSPIKEEIYSPDRLKEYARFLALGLEVSKEKSRGQSLLPQLQKNHQRLIKSYKSLTLSIKEKRPLTPAAEWIVDNFHIIEDQIREIKVDLPETYYRELPKINEGELKGYPRVYAIALTLVAHQDSHLDTFTMKGFLDEYQKVSPLLIGELWAIPIALRIALIENLRRIAEEVVFTQEVKTWADHLTDQLLKEQQTQENQENIENLIKEITENLGQSDTCDCALIAQLSRRLRYQSPYISKASEEINRYLTQQNSTTEKIVHADHQRQAANQVTVSNIISSMRLLSSLNWQVFFESVCLIEPILSQDPLNSYTRMDFEGRDLYRKEIERIQKRTDIEETEIAQKALDLAKQAHEKQTDDVRSHHVGYYLIKRGVRKLEKQLSYRPMFKERFRRLLTDNPTLSYVGLFFILTATTLSPILFYASLKGASTLTLILIAIMGIIPVSDSCLNIINLFFTKFLNPRTLPKFDLEKGIPDEAKTFVVIPTLFSCEKDIKHLVENLEIHYLSNQEPNLYFALLSDFSDDQSETTDKDQEILHIAKAGIRDLNQRYSRSNETIFYLFHRKRVWNAKEKKWMGWERKRGKLHEFNLFLMGKGKETTFISAPPRENLPNKIPYVITLDSDTQLPRMSPHRLIGAILHPLNIPQHDPKTNLVKEGYAILQPRISISPESSTRSTFAKIFSGHTGIDPYSTAVSDLYQDLFGEGIFTGKGLYVVESFERALSNRVPENKLLSHDLFEGLYARAALTTDIELFDEYPTNYDAFSKRQHRWSRGDWQIVEWTSGKTPRKNNTKEENPLSFISRWKILDNLRRSLVAPTTFIWLILSWTVLPGSPLIWTLLTLLILSIPTYAYATNGLFLHPRGVPWTSHFWNMWGNFQTNTAQLALSIICLPHQAYIQTDAIVRTLHRVFISKRNLLEWKTAADVESTLKKQTGLSPHLTWPTTISSVALLGLLSTTRSESLYIAAPFLTLWLGFPLIMTRLSREKAEKAPTYTDQERKELRHIARKTWHFFEKFVGKKTHWLPPDNFQEDPKPLLAQRTSPTNMGLQFLATTAAYDFGHITPLEALERCEKELETMIQLERYRGHFYNWYSTQTLEALFPKYISTVDSGNLAGHLLTAKQVFLNMPHHLFTEKCPLTGLRDTLEILLKTIEQSNRISSAKIHTDTLKTILPQLADSNYYSLRHCQETLHRLYVSLEDVEEDLAKNKDQIVNKHLNDIYDWLNTIVKSLKQLQDFHHHISVWHSENLKEISREMVKENPDLAPNWFHISENLDAPQSISKWRKTLETFRRDFHNFHKKALPLSSKGLSDKLDHKLQNLKEKIDSSLNFCLKFEQRSQALAWKLHEIVMDMEFDFLFHSQKKIFSIGYNQEEDKLDDAYYDLLASESRLASLVAIAKGDIPHKHWFHLGRQMTSLFHQRVLISWSASMFEYLMPLLVMKNYTNSLLFETHRAVVYQQIKFAKKRKIPWGVSESAYNARDLAMNYQYGPFGVPGLGLKRGLSDDRVISPYSTALAAMVSPKEAQTNFKSLEHLDLLTKFGFYEAIDYTKDRVPPKQDYAVIKSFMAHHQGMTLVALDNMLHKNVMQTRFHQDPAIRSCELFLQERTPQKSLIIHPRVEEAHFEREQDEASIATLREIKSVHTANPQTSFLSNGDYTVMITAVGSGFSLLENAMLGRWKEDITQDSSGQFIYINDSLSQKYWSTTFQPMGESPHCYKTVFSEHKAEFRCHREGLKSNLEVIVSAEDNVELRQVTLRNDSSLPREVSLTSYLEPILTNLEADLSHPAFSNLFTQTEFLEEKNALLANRRTRSPEDRSIWGVHLIATERDIFERNRQPEVIEYETTRDTFIGRGKTPRAPLALSSNRKLHNSTGAVLDPILCLRKKVHLDSGQRIKVCFVSGLASSREEALRLIDQYHDQPVFKREEEMSWTESQVNLKHLKTTPAESQMYQQLAGALLYSCGDLRPSPEVLQKNTETQSSLWAYGISGDIPILAVNIRDEQGLGLLKNVLKAHGYLRLKNIKLDLVIINTKASSYRLSLQEEILHLVRENGGQELLNKHQGIFVLRKDTISASSEILLKTTAKVYLDSYRGTLKDQLKRLNYGPGISSTLSEASSNSEQHWPDKPLKTPQLVFQNKWGGFTKDGKEYVIFYKENSSTPLPWVNVISNEEGFGTMVSERGSAHTWNMNAQANRISPWSNDPTSDPPGECFYIKDMETGDIWSPSPAPCPDRKDYLTRHGQGYTIFEHNSFGISQQMTIFVCQNTPMKIVSLKMRNETKLKRTLSLTYYLELVLGTNRSQDAHHILTKKEGDIFIAQNTYNEDYSKLLTFLSINKKVESFTCDRRTFIGRHGSMHLPQSLRAQKLNPKYGAGLDPCFAIQTKMVFEPGEEDILNIFIGQQEDLEKIKECISTYTRTEDVKSELSNVQSFWDELLEKVQIQTQYPEIDILMNRWLLYQTLSSRIWGRTGFYQSGGAYGFRDQLQDVTSLLHTRPDIARAHILKCAAHQFIEGDVMHWWHPVSEKGVRTKIADDLLWLPYVVNEYLQVTHDDSILNETVPFLEGPELKEDQEDIYFSPEVSSSQESLFEHCLRAIDRSLKVGEHGLPLMGGGDWNDGMNRIGIEGKGESVWLGWFLGSILQSFQDLCDKRHLTQKANEYRSHKEFLQKSIESYGWDGSWYKRAFFDNGESVGSQYNQECQIDSLTQSWASISGLCDTSRVNSALNSVKDYLIKDKEKMVLLFTPPFDQGDQNPGYIKGYVPGVRENGGQYTHAAIWVSLAYAFQGDKENALQTLNYLNPINHTKTLKEIETYQVEPYVIPADIYYAKGHMGRGGWTWYTGSASWFYRTFLEGIIGLQKSGEKLIFDSTPATSLGNIRISYKFGSSLYDIQISQESREATTVYLDSKRVVSREIPLKDDGKKHKVEFFF